MSECRLGYMHNLLATVVFYSSCNSLLFFSFKGVHVVQNYYGCEWDDVTQATKGYDAYGYDGEDWITLDLENLRYIAAKPQAFPTKQKWDANRGQIEMLKQYYSGQCIDWLKKYVGYGSSILNRKGKQHTAHLNNNL